MTVHRTAHAHGPTSSLPFAFGLTIAGAAVFCLLFVSLSALPTYGFSVEVLHFTVTVVGLRLGLGFVHFLYDRWIYKLSDPRVRATIGADLLG